jgi:hypothetical protein
VGRADDLLKRLTEGGEAVLDQFIEDRQAEELFLDFKRSADDGSGRKLHDTDRQNLAKAISGFGNSEGGIVVWGVDCSLQADLGDVARAKVPIENPKRFLSWLEGAVSGCTLPAHPRVRHLAIEFSARPNSGFVVTYIPQSYLAPHQCIKPPYYYVRTGSDFTPAPHGVIAGLFGRAPQAFVFHSWDLAPARLAKTRAGVEFVLGFRLGSWGPGLARDLYVNVQMRPPGGPSEFAVGPADNDWKSRQHFGVIADFVSVDGFKLAPLGQVLVFRWLARIEPPFESGLEYEISFGHAASPVRQVIWKLSAEELQGAFDRFVSSRQDAENGRQFVKDVMGLERPGGDFVYTEFSPPR